jgi:hypothetical protein
MRDTWYADKRDLVKWAVLLRLASMFEARRILQLAYFRPSQFGQVVIDGHGYDIPEEVIAHFRNLRTVGSICSKVHITVFDPVFKNREAYQKEVLALLLAFARERCIVFLDPDTGLAPKNPTLKHVLEREVQDIWNAMKPKDVLAFYQHQTNRAGQSWSEPKRLQLAQAIKVGVQEVKIARSPKIVDDVVFFFVQRP